MSYRGPVEYRVWHTDGKSKHWAGGNYDRFTKQAAARRKAQAIANRTGKKVQVKKYWDVGLVGEEWIEPKHIQQSIGAEFNPIHRGGLLHMAGKKEQLKYYRTQEAAERAGKRAQEKYHSVTVWRVDAVNWAVHAKDPRTKGSNPTSYGTSYFVNLAAAVRYYRPYHYEDTKAAVQRKLADGEIHIGKPPLKPGDTLQVIDGGTRYQITEGKRNPEAGLYDRIRPGSRVTIVNRFGQTQAGRAVMLGPAGWVLNLGGRYGTPGIAHPGNVVKVSGGHKARTLREASITGTAINPAKLNPGQLLFQTKEQALLYAATHGVKAFDLKPIKKTA